MPTYEYACNNCGNRLEVVQSFSDAPLTTCENCSGKLRKVFHAPGIAFKGEGFYKNDSRSTTSSGGSNSNASSNDTSSSNDSSDSPGTTSTPASDSSSAATTPSSPGGSNSAASPSGTN